MSNLDTLSGQIKINGVCGSVLLLPYPEDFDQIVSLNVILSSFPDILTNKDAFTYLLSYKNLKIEFQDIIKIFAHADKEVLKISLDNELFDSARKKIFNPGELLNKFFHFSLDSTNNLLNFMTS